MNLFHQHPEYNDRNEYCAIRTRLPENPDTKKAVIVLPWLMYRWWIASGDLDTIITKKSNAAHIHFDYPKTEFVMDKVIKQIKDYIKECPYEEIIIIGISFGGMLYRHLINALSDDEKKKIKHHISVNGLWTKEDLSLQMKLALLPANIKSNVINEIIGVFGIINRKLWWIATKNQVYNKYFNSKIQKDLNQKNSLLLKQKHHQKSAANGFTPGYADRAKWVAWDTEIWEIQDIDTSFIYSNNDDFYKNPKLHAEKMWEKVVNAKVEYYEVEWWRHQALVELPEKYNPVLEQIFNEVWLPNK